MGNEIEAKARCGDLDAVRATLRALGARLAKSGFEHNVLFDTPDGSLQAADSLLRLRKFDKTVITYKGPRAERKPVKSRLELEVEVSDFDTAAAIFEGLGFRRAWTYQKRREEWTFRGAKICLDEVPDIGGFVEVEGGAEGEVVAVLGELGISMSDVTPQTYVEIWKEHTRYSGGRLEDMVFHDKEAR